MKKAMIFSVFFSLLSGCNFLGLTDAEMEVAKSSISEDMYSNYLTGKYNSLLESYSVNNEKIDIYPLGSYMNELSLINSCGKLIEIKESDIEVIKYDLRPDKYKMSPTENINKNPFFKCVDNYLEKTELDAENLNNLINHPDYIKMKRNPDFVKKINTIKSDGRINIRETLEILSMISSYQTENKAKEYYSKISKL